MTWGTSRKTTAAKAEWFRRALSIDVRVRPDDSWGELEIAGASGQWHRISRDHLRKLMGLTKWARDPGLSTADLIARELLYYAENDPGVALSGESGVLARKGKIARRHSMWPTLAVETAIEIAPMPFMPRGRDLAGAALVGLRLASREKGHEVMSASITGKPRTGAVLRRLMPLLDGSRTEAEIIAALPAADQTHGSKLLALLDDLTALTDEVVPRWTPPAGKPRVTWLGHAAVLVETEGLAMLVDPLFFAPSDPPERWLSGMRFDPRTLPHIDLVLITHGDNDHLNPTALLHLPPSTPILIPKVGSQPEPWQVDLRGVLECLGFERILELDTHDTLDVGPLRVTACPFEGEDWELELPKATWLIAGPTLSAYFAADSLPGAETLAWLAERPIDVAFLGVSDCSEAFAAPRELGYGNFYDPWVPAERRMEWVRHTAGPREAANAARAVKPRFAFGYAAGGASYIQTAYSDSGDHALFAQLLQSPTKPLDLTIGVPQEITR